MLDLIAQQAAFALALGALAMQAKRTFKPYVAPAPKRKRTGRIKKSDYPADWDALETEVRAECLNARKQMARDMLAANPDTSADAIAEYHGISKHSARAMSKGLGRRTAKQHKGNDYEVRGA